jgi:Tfp pilus assembly protein PilP
MKVASSVIIAGLAVALAGCSGGNASSVPSASAPTAPKPIATPAPSPQPVATTTPAELPAPPAVKYDSKGRRDPFENLEVREGASGPTLASAKLTGIVRGSRGPLALVETSDGLGYILKPGDTLGDGRVLEIGPDSVVFRIAVRTGSTTDRVVLRLPGD